MKVFSLRAGVLAGGVLSATVLSTNTVLADGSRFRGGIAAELGAFIPTQTSRRVTVIGAGVEGQLGIQDDQGVGFYFAPGFRHLFTHGAPDGTDVGSGLIVDYTPVDAFTIGGGPDVSFFDAFDLTIFIGGRLHLAWNPVVTRYDPGRAAWTIGADVRILSGLVGDDGVMVAPMLTVGIQAF